jgi:DNA-binding transcriptional MerR regulator
MDCVESTSKQVIQIGDFAKRAGVSVRAIRYYEELGLIRPESHSVGGFRLYAEDGLRRLQVIGFLKELGLSLMEIRQILLANTHGTGNRDTVQFLITVFNDRLRQIEFKIEALAKVRGELANALRILNSCDRCDKAILLDRKACDCCASLHSGEAVPDTFKEILS